MRCYVNSDKHEFPVEDQVGACCPDHGVTLLWRGDPITSAETVRGSTFPLDALSAGTDGPCSVVCRSAQVTDLADVHGLCGLPGCACPCHAAVTVSRDAG